VTVNVDELRAALTEVAGDRPDAGGAYDGVVRRVRRARRRRFSAGAAVVAVVVLASFVGIRAIGDDGSLPRVATALPTTTVTEPPPTTAVTIPGGVQSALDAWKGFPVDASPRPLIVFEPVNAPEGGFPDNDTKLAWESGQLRVGTTLPPAPSDGVYPLVGAQVAVDRIEAEATPGPTATTPLTVTSATLGTAAFSTDRGTHVLPAWIVSFAGIANPAQVLAVGPSALFQPPAPTTGVHGGGGGAVTLVGDRTLQVRLVGKAAGDGPCEARYEVRAYESDQAVAIATREIPKASSPTTSTTDSGSLTLCADVGSTQTVTTTIERPLGNRVVVNGATRAPLAVTAASG
jgi:hypothetical protein